MASKEIDLLLEQMDARFEQNNWFVSFLTGLKDTTAEEAAWQPTDQTNTIWQIVNHLYFWNTDVVARVKGLPPKHGDIDNDDTFGPPGDPNDETGWQATLHGLFKVLEELRSVTSQLDDVRLEQQYRPGSPTIKQLLANVVMHDTYHLGQIVLLRKVRGSWPGYQW